MTIHARHDAGVFFLEKIMSRCHDEDFTPERDIPEEEQLCMNCRHYDIMHAVITYVHGPKRGQWKTVEVAPCFLSANIADFCGDAVVLMEGTGHCRETAGAFEPSDIYLSMQRDAPHDYGVRPGIDYPATL